MESLPVGLNHHSSFKKFLSIQLWGTTLLLVNFYTYYGDYSSKILHLPRGKRRLYGVSLSAIDNFLPFSCWRYVVLLMEAAQIFIFNHLNWFFTLQILVTDRNPIYLCVVWARDCFSSITARFSDQWLGKWLVLLHLLSLCTWFYASLFMPLANVLAVFPINLKFTTWILFCHFIQSIDISIGRPNIFRSLATLFSFTKEKEAYVFFFLRGSGWGRKENRGLRGDYQS